MLPLRLHPDELRPSSARGEPVPSHQAAPLTSTSTAEKSRRVSSVSAVARHQHAAGAGACKEVRLAAPWGSRCAVATSFLASGSCGSCAGAHEEDTERVDARRRCPAPPARRRRRDVQRRGLNRALRCPRRRADVPWAFRCAAATSVATASSTPSPPLATVALVRLSSALARKTGRGEVVCGMRGRSSPLAVASGCGCSSRAGRRGQEELAWPQRVGAGLPPDPGEAGEAGRGAIGDEGRRRVDSGGGCRSGVGPVAPSAGVEARRSSPRFLARAR
ncbi:uncharacterized protein [Triticum aestivum]|uniref:uncharacterized protein n=1 Tax=Triticum aestivum TaxID=4565 RepID=UPI001D002FE9|nr:uncharacterized protein LOC123177822 [Triticum aestivum]